MKKSPPPHSSIFIVFNITGLSFFNQISIEFSAGFSPEKSNQRKSNSQYYPVFTQHICFLYGPRLLQVTAPRTANSYNTFSFQEKFLFQNSNGGNNLDSMNFKTPIPYSRIFIKFGRVLVLLEKSERIILKLFH